MSLSATFTLWLFGSNICNLMDCFSSYSLFALESILLMILNLGRTPHLLRCEILFGISQTTDSSDLSVSFLTNISLLYNDTI